jgi:hypothetical protein
MSKMTPTKLGVGVGCGRQNHISSNWKKPAKSDICPICNTVVAVGDSDAIKFNGQSYHFSQLLQDDLRTEHQQVFNNLLALHATLKSLPKKTSEEAQTFKELHKVLFKTNGISKK